MRKEVIIIKKAITVAFRNRDVKSTFNIPRYCPNCGSTISPDVIYAHSSASTEGSFNALVGLLLQCTDEDCAKYFELEYMVTIKNALTVTPNSEPVKKSMVPPVADNFPAEVSEVSPIFKKTYDQALTAEKIGLDQIAGVGYRKAVEFLVKDYLISVKNKPADEIKKDFLMPAINKIDYQPIHDLATAATWIGNDETHYVRTWEDQDIEDMKAFIRSCVFFISSDLSVIKSQEMIAQAKAEKEAKKKQQSNS